MVAICKLVPPRCNGDGLCLFDQGFTAQLQHCFSNYAKFPPILSSFWLEVYLSCCAPSTPTVFDGIDCAQSIASSLKISILWRKDTLVYRKMKLLLPGGRGAGGIII